MDEVVPGDLIVVGRVADAWGLRGGLKLVPFSPDADAMLSVSEWWFTLHDVTRSFDIREAREHGGVITAIVTGISDRDSAEKFKGATVSVARSRFPVLEADEYYWIDLIGLRVMNLAQEDLGTVTGLMENGAHQLLQVGLDDGKPLLIPFVDAHVKTVDRQARTIVVDWGRDY